MPVGGAGIAQMVASTCRHKRFCTCPYITSTPACLWEETREVKRKHQSTLEKWAYTDGTAQYFDRTDAEAEERKRGMQEASVLSKYCTVPSV